MKKNYACTLAALACSCTLGLNAGSYSQTEREDEVTRIVYFDYDKHGNMLESSIAMKEKPIPSPTLPGTGDGDDTDDPLKSTKNKEQLQHLASQKNNIQLYPNPNNGVFTLLLPANKKQEDCFVSLYNTKSELLYTSRVSGTSNTLDISHFPAGIYIMVVKTTESIEQFKIVKQ